MTWLKFQILFGTLWVADDRLMSGWKDGQGTPKEFPVSSFEKNLSVLVDENTLLWWDYASFHESKL